MKGPAISPQTKYPVMRGIPICGTTCDTDAEATATARKLSAVFESGMYSFNNSPPVENCNGRSKDLDN